MIGLKFLKKLKFELKLSSKNYVYLEINRSWIGQLVGFGCVVFSLVSFLFRNLNFKN